MWRDWIEEKKDVLLNLEEKKRCVKGLKKDGINLNLNKNNNAK